MSLVEHENVPENPNDMKPIGQDNAHVSNDINVNLKNPFNVARGVEYGVKGPAATIQPAQTADDVWKQLNEQNPNAPLDHSVAAVGHNLAAPNQGLLGMSSGVKGSDIGAGIDQLGAGISELANAFLSKPEPTPVLERNFAPPPPQHGLFA